MGSAPTRRVTTALAARDRLKVCEEFLQTLAGDELVIVAPTRMAADELARSFCLSSAGSFGMHRFSLGALAVEIASPRLAASGKSVLAGVAVVTRRAGVAGSVGMFGWDGGLGTSWYSDPQEDMVAVLMTQRAWTSPSPPDVCLDFWTLAYQAIDD